MWLIDEIAASAMSTPASTAFTMAAVLMPVVAWECSAIGADSVSLSLDTISSAT